MSTELPLCLVPTPSGECDLPRGHSQHHSCDGWIYISPAKTPHDTWRLFAMRLGPDTYKEPRLMFEGSFKSAHAFMDWLENMPMNTPGMEAISQVQNPQPFKVKVVGPLVTMVMTNKRKCLELKINA